MRRMSSATLRLEMFTSRPCLTSLTPWLSLSNFSGSEWFHDVLQGCVEQDCAEWINRLGSPQAVELVAFDVCVHVRSLLVVELAFLKSMADIFPVAMERHME